MRRNLILVTSLIAAIALAAIVLPLELVPQNNKIQAQAQTQASAVSADNPPDPPHDMAKMMAGQDSSMYSDQTNGMQDNDTQNALLSKTKSQVHLGMIFFVSMLFLDNAINVYAYFAMFNLYQAELLPFVYWLELSN